MRIFNWLAELRYRNEILYRLGLMHFIVFFLLLFMLVLDGRQVLGINTWIKPMKFSLSIGIYSWTVGWMMFDLQASKKWNRGLSWTIALSMILEFIVILFQASRATRSHFNFDTDMDGILFGIMGIMILVNTLAIALLFLLYLRKLPHLDRVYLTAVRVGILLFLVASYVGKIMVDNVAHSVGGEDGGPGLPFLNWSMEFGDLRVAHFLGLHALQIIPLFAYFQKKYTRLTPSSRILYLIIFTVLYSGIFALIYYQALQGHPFIARFSGNG